MTTNRNVAGGPARRAFEPRSWARPPGIALLGLALYGLIQSGCASDGCSTCGLGSKFNRGVQAVGAGIQSGFQSVGSVFHHKRGCGGESDCGCAGGLGSSMEEGMVMNSGVQIMPGGMALPAPGTIVPAPSLESAPTQLEPIPASPTSGTGTTSPKSSTSRMLPNGNSRSAYTTMQPTRRGSDLSQALHSTPEGKGRASDPNNSPDLFANIPPVDLPSEVTRKAVGTTSGTNPGPAPAATQPSAPTGDNVTPTATEKVSAAEGETLSLPPINAVTAHQAPGLYRYSSVAPTVGGGSAPTIEGLDWLNEKGYRTFVDLRKGSEVEANFVDAVNDRGMVYISLPIMANRLDAARLARFDDLLSQSDNRPLYFCDKDGTRAGLAWYIHLRVIGQEDSQAATTKAEEIGLTDAEVKIAEEYLATHKPKAKTAMTRVAQAISTSAAEITPPPAPAVPTSALPTSPATPAPVPTPAAPPGPSVEPTPAMLPGEHRPQASTGPAPDYREPGSWRPAAALVLTSLGVPLAYWGRSMFSESRSVRRRASLPGSKPRSLEAPVGSDA